MALMRHQNLQKTSWNEYSTPSPRIYSEVLLYIPLRNVIEMLIFEGALKYNSLGDYYYSPIGHYISINEYTSSIKFHPQLQYQDINKGISCGESDCDGKLSVTDGLSPNTAHDLLYTGINRNMEKETGRKIKKKEKIIKKEKQTKISAVFWNAYATTNKLPFIPSCRKN